MREVKFQGKSVETQAWVVGYCYQTEKDGLLYSFIMDKTGKSHEVYFNTIGEYSGYNDFFEGDIVAGFNNLFVVKQGNVIIKKVAPNKTANNVEISCFYLDNNGTPLFPLVNNYKGEHDLKGLKKVGNVWDNPELVKREGRT